MSRKGGVIPGPPSPERCIVDIKSRFPRVLANPDIESSISWVPYCGDFSLVDYISQSTPALQGAPAGNSAVAGAIIVPTRIATPVTGVA